MLQDDFYKVLSIDTVNSQVKLVLAINADHIIFSGHFPDMPVVPGVCMMQIVKEIAEKMTGTSLLLSRSDLMKFLAVVDPTVSRNLEVDFSYKKTAEGSIDVSTNFSTGTTVCFKFKGKFTPIN